MKKEQAFKELLNILKIKEDKQKYPNSIFYFKNKECYFEYDKKNGDFWCVYDKVWKVFETKYGMEHQQIRVFIKVQVEEHFKLKGLTPVPDYRMISYKVEEHFKLKGLTSIQNFFYSVQELEEHFNLKYSNSY